MLVVVTLFVYRKENRVGLHHYNFCTKTISFLEEQFRSISGQVPLFPRIIDDRDGIELNCELITRLSSGVMLPSPLLLLILPTIKGHLKVRMTFTFTLIRI